MSNLAIGSLYVLLDLRSPDIVDRTFHWALYFHKADKPYSKGHKYHIKTLGDGWIAEHATMSGIMKGFLLVCLVRVARDIPAARWDAELDKIMAMDDSHINDGSFTCRVWVLRALERLRNAGILSCGDVVQLEEQLRSVGNRHRATAILNQQPRPIVDLTSL